MTTSDLRQRSVAERATVRPREALETPRLPTFAQENYQLEMGDWVDKGWYQDLTPQMQTAVDRGGVEAISTEGMSGEEKFDKYIEWGLIPEGSEYAGDKEGEPQYYTPEQVREREEYETLPGEGKFEALVEQGLIPEGSEYVGEEEGQISYLTPEQVKDREEYEALPGEEKFERLMTEGLIPQGAEYVGIEEGQISYLTPQQAEEREAYAALSGEEKFKLMVEAGTIPGGSEYVGEEEGQISYLTPEQVKAREEHDAYEALSDEEKFRQAIDKGLIPEGSELIGIEGGQFVYRTREQMLQRREYDSAIRRLGPYAAGSELDWPSDVEIPPGATVLERASAVAGLPSSIPRYVGWDTTEDVRPVVGRTYEIPMDYAIPSGAISVSGPGRYGGKLIRWPVPKHRIKLAEGEGYDLVAARLGGVPEVVIGHAISDEALAAVRGSVEDVQEAFEPLTPVGVSTQPRATESDVFDWLDANVPSKVVRDAWKGVVEERGVDYVLKDPDVGEVMAEMMDWPSDWQSRVLAGVEPPVTPAVTEEYRAILWELPEERQARESREAQGALSTESYASFMDQLAPYETEDGKYRLDLVLFDKPELKSELIPVFGGTDVLAAADRLHGVDVWEDKFTSSAPNQIEYLKSNTPDYSYNRSAKVNALKAAGVYSKVANAYRERWGRPTLATRQLGSVYGDDGELLENRLEVLWREGVLTAEEKLVVLEAYKQSPGFKPFLEQLEGYSGFLGEMALGMIPVYGTIRNWDEMSTPWKAASVVLDAVTIVPVAKVAAVTGKAGTIRAITYLPKTKGVPSRALGVELDVSRVAQSPLRFSEGRVVMDEALRAQLARAAPEGKMVGVASVPGVGEVGYRITPMQQVNPRVLYHATPDSDVFIQSIKSEGRVTVGDSGLFTSPQAAWDFMAGGAGKNTPPKNPALIAINIEPDDLLGVSGRNIGDVAIREDVGKGFRSPYKTYKGRFEAELVGTPGTELYPTAADKWSILHGTARGITGESYTQYPGATMRITGHPLKYDVRTGRVVKGTQMETATIQYGQRVPIVHLRSSGGSKLAPSAADVQAAKILALKETVKDIPYYRLRKVEFAVGREVPSAPNPFRNSRQAYGKLKKISAELEEEAFEFAQKSGATGDEYVRVFQEGVDRAASRKIAEGLSPEEMAFIRSGEFEMPYVVNLSRLGEAVGRRGLHGIVRADSIAGSVPSRVLAREYKEAMMERPEIADEIAVEEELLPSERMVVPPGELVEGEVVAVPELQTAGALLPTEEVSPSDLEQLPAELVAEIPEREAVPEAPREWAYEDLVEEPIPYDAEEATAELRGTVYEGEPPVVREEVAEGVPPREAREMPVERGVVEEASLDLGLTAAGIVEAGPGTPMPSGTDEQSRKVVPEGSVSWRQGLTWITVMPPYTESDMIFTDMPPEGSTHTDTGLPNETIEGGPNVKFTVPWGMFNVTYDHGRLVYGKRRSAAASQGEEVLISEEEMAELGQSRPISQMRESRGWSQGPSPDDFTDVGMVSLS